MSAGAAQQHMAGMGLVAPAYADCPLIACHFGRAHVVPTAWVPILYSVAMATEAVATLVLGRAFDRFGLLTVVAATVLTACFAPLVFLGGAGLAVVGVLEWELGTAAQESIVRSVITGMAGPGHRASAYGLFDTGFDICWFAGSVVRGVLYSYSITVLVVFSVAAQLAALPLLLATRRSLPATKL
ncbi:hypothetical protein ACFVT1_09065 [Streptomyces sp. NPDC057963]|uniref:hypothetical protein n=1 Tax=Streptomyces sp. NPDC057963 TaxID=3346290 RepID=UPI0036E555BA